MRTTRRLFSAAPRPGIPAFKFKFDRATANRRMAKHSSILESGARDKNQKLPEPSDGDPVTECFVPCYSADIKGVVTEYIAEFGINRTETHFIWQTVNNQLQMVPQIYVVTDWYSTKGKLKAIDYPFGTVKTQFYSGYDYPRELIEPVIRTSFVGGLRPLTEKMVNAYGTRKIVQPHEMTREKAIEKVAAAVNDLERERVTQAVIDTVVTQRGVHPDGGIRITSINVMMNKSQFKMFSYYVGVYVYQYRFGDFSRYKFLNAHNGQINGNKVLSIATFTTAGAVFGGMLTALTLLANPYLIPVRLSIQIAVGATLGGAVSAGFARLFNQYDRYHFANATKREKEENAGYPRTREDKEAQRFADEMNKNYEYTTPDENSGKPRLPREKLSLLGLTPDMDITLDILHKAYINQLKMYHPDVADKKISNENANAMTRAITEAYQTVRNILEQHEAANDQQQNDRKNQP